MIEAHAQLFFYNQIVTKESHSRIRIAEIYHAFKSDKGDTYIVMEYIDIRNRASDEQRAQAISELISVKPPSGSFGTIGCGSGFINHNFFRDREAPILFSSVLELEVYINRVRRFIYYLFVLN